MLQEFTFCYKFIIKKQFLYKKKLYIYRVNGENNMGFLDGIKFGLFQSFLGANFFSPFRFCTMNFPIFQPMSFFPNPIFMNQPLIYPNTISIFNNYIDPSILPKFTPSGDIFEKSNTNTVSKEISTENKKENTEKQKVTNAPTEQSTKVSTTATSSENRTATEPISSQTDTTIKPATVQKPVANPIASATVTTKTASNTQRTTKTQSRHKTSTKKTEAKHWSKMTDEEMKEIYGDYARDITIPYKGTVTQLNKYLKGKGKLEGKGQAFMDAQEKYGISASVLIGICMNECANGTSRLAREKNNVASIRRNRTSFKTYNTVEDCINDLAQLLSNHYVNGKTKSLKKLYQINAKYCPVADPEDKKQLNCYWARNVEYKTKEVEQTA